MTWPIRYHETPPEHPRAGDCWPAHWLIEGEDRETYRSTYLTAQYFREHYGQRAPLFVRLPDGSEFCIDSRATGKETGWTVTGEPHNGTLTVSPSINIKGSYHGFIQNGVVTDDCEGRKFPLANLPPAPARPFWRDLL